LYKESNTFSVCQMKFTVGNQYICIYTRSSRLNNYQLPIPVDSFIILTLPNQPNASWQEVTNDCCQIK